MIGVPRAGRSHVVTGGQVGVTVPSEIPEPLRTAVDPILHICLGHAADHRDPTALAGRGRHELAHHPSRDDSMIPRTSVKKTGATNAISAPRRALYVSIACAASSVSTSCLGVLKQQSTALNNSRPRDKTERRWSFFLRVTMTWNVRRAEVLTPGNTGHRFRSLHITAVTDASGHGPA